LFHKASLLINGRGFQYIVIIFIFQYVKSLCESCVWATAGAKPV